jgi:hypothetical protein
MTQEFESVTPSFDPALASDGIFIAPELDTSFPDVGEKVEQSNQRLTHVAQMTGRALLRTVETAVMVGEVSPLNEMMRVAAGAAAIKAGISPEGVAAVYGGSTLIIESSAAVVAARWLSGERSKKTINWFNEKLENRGISPDAKFNKITKAGIVLFGGSAISQTVEVREVPELEKPEIRKHGLKVAGLLAGLCTVQGYFVGQGFETPNPATIGGAAIAVGSLVGLGGWIQKRVKKEQIDQGIDVEALKAEAKKMRKQAKIERKQEKINRRKMK